MIDRKEYHKKYYTTHRIKYLKEYVPTWRKKNPLKVKEYARKDRIKNKEYYREYLRKYTQKNKSAAYTILGGFKCNRCGITDYRVLQLDHINGGGQKQMRVVGHQHYKDYKWIIANPIEAQSKYMILCANCNWIKRYENNEFRH
jgi:hypothetical protein